MVGLMFKSGLNSLSYIKKEASEGCKFFELNFKQWFHRKWIIL